ncbi:MAG TPA: 2-polyprenylphenol 6-hydroxylase, partial [Alphaproteobacteria bacterium]|nr:2-polyprenylphenol 6-hydroxylase [Alphaproteobacteria bacterium]
PEVNMWALARPLVEDWVRENRTPEAVLGEMAETVAEAAQGLPELARQTRSLLSELADGGLRLHPDTLAALAARGRGSRALLWPLWLAVALLFLILIGLIGL